MRRLLLVAGLLIMADSGAASLQLCPDQQPAAARHEALVASVTRPDGTRQRLSVTDAPSSACRSRALPLAADDILALRPLGKQQAATLGDTIVLQGPQRPDRFIFDTVTGSGAVARAPATRLPMPLHDNLLAHMQALAFGSEERARASLADGRLHLRCDAGTRPAGVVLAGPWSMTQAELALQLNAHGSGSFEVQALDQQARTNEAPVVLGQFLAGAGEKTFALPRSDFDRAQWRAFAIACPEQKAELTVEALKLAAPIVTRPSRSTWVWNAGEWQTQPERVFAQAQRHGVKSLFISVPVAADAVADAVALAAFIQDASRRGLAVWSVDGDPHMVLPTETAAAVRRMRAYAAYNASVPASARLAGSQFDIEPYLLPGYELDSAGWDHRYLDTARALHDAAGALPLEFVVPFWWADKTALLHALGPFASSLSVMDYRTEPQEIIRFAAPFLDWGVLHERKVRIALEAGPLEVEQQRRYVRADSGECWLTEIDGVPVLLLLKEARPNPLGPAFREAGSRVVDGSATTFHRNPQRLIALLPQLEAALGAWPSFGGIALHELKE